MKRSARALRWGLDMTRALVWSLAPSNGRSALVIMEDLRSTASVFTNQRRSASNPSATRLNASATQSRSSQSMQSQQSPTALRIEGHGSQRGTCRSWQPAVLVGAVVANGVPDVCVRLHLGEPGVLLQLGNDVALWLALVKLRADRIARSADQAARALLNRVLVDTGKHHVLNYLLVNNRA